MKRHDSTTKFKQTTALMRMAAALIKASATLVSQRRLDILIFANTRYNKGLLCRIILVRLFVGVNQSVVDAAFLKKKSLNTVGVMSVISCRALLTRFSLEYITEVFASPPTA